MDVQCPCTENPYILSSSNFVVGEIYRLVIDGCAGNICDYSIQVLSGLILTGAPNNPGPIAGPTNVNLNSTTNYSVPPTGASDYQWTLTPPIGSFSSNTNTVDVTWTATGIAELCVTSTNDCGTNPTPSCITINVTSQPPPPNDDCINAEPIGCGQTVAGTTQYATADSPNAPSCTTTTFPGVWYSFVGNGGFATLSTCGGASFNTKLSVYEGGCGGLNCVAGNDDFCGVQSQVVINAVSGTTYYVLVHGAGSATGTFNLSLYCTSPMPPNGSGTVACPNLATVPTPPTYTSPNCAPSGPITPTGPVTVTNPNPLSCEGTITYTWTYTDCVGASINWSFEYTIEREPFTNMPANGAGTVACPAQATQPVPPTVQDNCGAAITPTGPVVTNSPDPVTCLGTRTYTWSYADCEGNSQTWSFVYAIGPPSFNLPPSGGALVDCPDDTDVQPVPPVVTNSCNTAVTPILFSVSSKPDCEGERIYTFRYANCDNSFADWPFIYTIEYLDFSVPPSETLTVDCPSNAVVPSPPAVQDNCSKPLTPTGPEVTSTTNPGGCETSIQYAWTYTDCEGNSHVWSRTYMFDFAGKFTPPTNEEVAVSCGTSILPPSPQVRFDDCGREITPTGPIITEDISPLGCTGFRTYTYLYTDCAGNNYPWSVTYQINDNEPPLGNCPDIGVTNLPCNTQLPCPDTYDFSPKMSELLALGNFYDECSGSNLTVELDSWTAVWECSDIDGDNAYTFGRTFFFRVADACGNAFPTLCEVTYSGQCLPLEMFPQTEWGVAGGAPGNTVSPVVNDIVMIQELLNMAPFIIGGPNRSMTVTTAQCIVDLLPSVGFPTTLANCQELNCTGCNPKGVSSIKNSLAANTMALLLNLRYNERYNDLTVANSRLQGLGCIVIDSTIVYCTNGAQDCRLRITELNGTVHDYHYTIGGLLDLANLYLNGQLVLNLEQSFAIARALNVSIQNVNGLWNGGTVVDNCDPGAGQ